VVETIEWNGKLFVEQGLGRESKVNCSSGSCRVEAKPTWLVNDDRTERCDLSADRAIATGGRDSRFDKGISML
jgi:hypothetical protein